MLLNIAKLRYSDTPVFVDVPSVINQYAIQGRINLDAGWENGASSIKSQNLGVEGLYAERPTITYTPLTGDKFTRSLLTPIPPASLLFLIQSGWPGKPLFEICVKSVNEIDNRSSAPGFARCPDPRFQKLVEAMERIQRSGAVGARIVKQDDLETAIIVFRQNVDSEIECDISQIRELLNTKPDATEMAVTYGTTPTTDGEIALLTRSIMDIIVEMSSQIDVPNEHAAEGRTHATSLEIGSGKDQVPPFSAIYSDKQKPDDAFPAIRYRDYWFWIDDCDRSSKGHFTFLMILFSLAETGGVSQTPLITVPVN